MSANDYITVPTHPRLRVQAYPSGDGLVTLWYIGDVDDLIAAGIGIPEMFWAQKKKGPRPRGPHACPVSSRHSKRTKQLSDV
jgi:hypothetical protein